MGGNEQKRAKEAEIFLKKENKNVTEMLCEAAGEICLPGSFLFLMQQFRFDRSFPAVTLISRVVL